MKNKFVFGIVVLGFLAPFVMQAADGTRSFSGIVTKVVGNQVTIKTSSAATYTAETSQAQLVRKNGAAMKLDEIAVGDKLEIAGRLWPDNSMNALTVRNLSLYVHTGTFTGKVVSVDSVSATFVMQGRQYGTQTIHADFLTTFKKNKAAATFKDLETGASVTVKGSWDRSRSDVVAKQVEATVRLVSIEITGKLMMRGPTFLTVVGQNNVLYGVDITSAKLKSKSGAEITIERLPMGNVLKISGKHISEGAQIIAATVRDLGYTK